jgi:outer membrane protein TolC
LAALLGIGFGSGSAWAAGSVPWTLRRALSRAAEANPSVLAARERIGQAREIVEAAKADLRPDGDLADTHSYTNRTFPAFFNVPRYTHSVNAVIKQRVFSGGSLQALVRQARGRVDEAEATYRDVLENTLERVANAFLDVHEQSATQKAHTEAISTQRRRLEDIQARIDAGVMLETNRLQAEIVLLEEERRLLVSETSEKLARNRLAVLLALEEGASFELVEALAPLEDVDAEGLAGMSADNAPSVQRLEAQIDQAQARVSAAEGAFRPQVDLQVQQVHVANGLSFASQDANYAEAFGTVNLPLFDGGKRRSQLSEARRGLNASRLEARMARDEVTIQVGQAMLGIQEAQARLKAGEVRVELAEKNRRIVNDRYLEGAAIQSEILDADVEWRRAQLEVITSRFGVLRGVVQLLRLTGNLGRAALLGATAIPTVVSKG